MEVTERRENNQDSDKSGFGRLAEDAYNRTRRVRANSSQQELDTETSGGSETSSRVQSRSKCQMSPNGKKEETTCQH
jgi:hypothetical protein